MSLDLNYYSFNAKRADKQWKTFPEDISVLRAKFHDSMKAKMAYDAKLQKIREEIEPIYKEKKHLKRLEIFKSFSDRNLFLSGRTSWKYEGNSNDAYYETSQRDYEEALMESLLIWELVYPGGVKTPPDSGKWQRLDPKSARDYFAIEEEQRIKIREAESKLSGLDSSVGSDIELTEEQKKLEKSVDFIYLVYGDTYDLNELTREIKRTDLYFGSVENDFFEDNKVAVFVMEDILAEALDLKHDGDPPLGSELVKLYDSLDKDMMTKLTGAISRGFGWDDENTVQFTMDFFKALRPVVKDLKENPDSVLIGCANGEFYPQTAEKILLERAKEYAEAFKGVLPPVL